MKQKIIKGVAIATLSLMFFFCLVPQAKASSSVSATYEEVETIYNDYFYESYIVINGELPPQFSEMLDICANTNPNMNDIEVLVELRFLMYEFMVQNSEMLFSYVYHGALNDCANNHEQIEYEARTSGYSQGYINGKNDAEAQMTIEKLESYSEGYNLGLEEGKVEGLQLGYAQYEEEKGSIYDLKDLIFTIINAPFNIIKGALNFEVFGVNVSGLVLFLVSCGLVVFVLKKIL